MATGRRLNSAGVTALAAGLLLVAPCAPAAPKTDVVTLENGDRYTGEVKGLVQGKLQLKTDAAGTIYIEWAKVTTLQSNQVLQVELYSGERYLGQAPEPGDENQLLIVGMEGARPRNLAIADIIRIEPIEMGHLIKRLDGYVTAGYDYTKANDLQQFTFTGGLSSRTERREWTLDGSQTLTSQEGDDDSNRWSVDTMARLFLRDRWFLQGGGGFESNDELALDLRMLVGGAFGRFLLQNDRQEWAVYSGLVYNSEKYGGPQSEESVEALFGTQYSFFRYDSPEASLDVSLNLYPSLTQSGRFRSQSQLRSRYEIVKDLFFEVSLYGSYDNEPGDNAVSNSDYGLTTSLGYSF
jgi:hypothetical protein